MKKLFATIVLAAMSVGAGPASRPSTMPTSSINGMNVTLMDTYVSDIKISKRGVGDRPVTWVSVGDHLCCLLMIQNDTEKPIRYVTWHGRLMDYKEFNKNKGAAAEIPSLVPFVDYDWAVATSDISKASWDDIFKRAAKKAIAKYGKDEDKGAAYMSEVIDQTFMFTPDGIHDMGFKTMEFFNTDIKPHSAVLDILIFAMPLKDSNLTLNLSAENVGGVGSIVFPIDKADIRYITTDWAAARQLDAKN